MSEMTGSSSELRFVTYLSPGLPVEFFEAVVEDVRRALRIRASLSVASRFSGPPRGGDDLFSRGEADIGFMCAPPFLWLRELARPPVELVGAAPVFRDKRALGEPVYFSEVIVNSRSDPERPSDLRGCVWAYNDPCSLSGYYNVLKKLADGGEAYSGRMVCSGSHLESLNMVARGEVDAAAVDSNVLRIRLARKPRLRERLRVIETWGPFPIQPVVVRTNLPPKLKEDLLAALLSIGPETSSVLSELGLEGFAPVSLEHYAAEEKALRECESLPGTRPPPDGGG